MRDGKNQDEREGGIYSAKKPGGKICFKVSEVSFFNSKVCGKKRGNVQGEKG